MMCGARVVDQKDSDGKAVEGPTGMSCGTCVAENTRSGVRRRTLIGGYWYAARESRLPGDWPDLMGERNWSSHLQSQLIGKLI